MPRRAFNGRYGRDHRRRTGSGSGYPAPHATGLAFLLVQRARKAQRYLCDSLSDRARYLHCWVLDARQGTANALHGPGSVLPALLGLLAAVGDLLRALAVHLQR